MTTNEHLDVHDLVAELTRTHQHREAYAYERGNGEQWASHHTTSVPALVHQLLDAQPASSGAESGSAASSRPNARIEAIDTLMLIDHEASMWVKRLGHDDPGDTYHDGRRVPGSGTITCLQLLGSLYPSQEHCGRAKPHRTKAGKPDCCTRHHIEHDVRRWWRQARIISGWDSAAWRPRNTCPVCDQAQSLRISLAQHSALCIECRSTWGPEEIGILAEWIRTENADETDAAVVTTG